MRIEVLVEVLVTYILFVFGSVLSSGMVTDFNLILSKFGESVTVMEKLSTITSYVVSASPNSFILMR